MILSEVSESNDCNPFWCTQFCASALQLSLYSISIQAAYRSHYCNSRIVHPSYNSRILRVSYEVALEEILNDAQPQMHDENDSNSYEFEDEASLDAPNMILRSKRLRNEVYEQLLMPESVLCIHDVKPLECIPELNVAIGSDGHLISDINCSIPCGLQSAACSSSLF